MSGTSQCVLDFSCRCYGVELLRAVCFVAKGQLSGSAGCQNNAALMMCFFRRVLLLCGGRPYAFEQPHSFVGF
jgi:hypothetical protein